MLKKYKNFQYKHKQKNVWELIFPSGFRTTVFVNSEEEIKQKIDELRLQYGDTRED